jgi:hypothetical protein
MTFPMVVMLIIGWTLVIPALVVAAALLRASNGSLRRPPVAPAKVAVVRAEAQTPRRERTNGTVRKRIFTSSQSDQFAPYK